MQKGPKANHLQIASVMGMSVSVDLLQATYPIPATSEALEGDLMQLEKANFLRPTDVPGTWHMTQARLCCCKCSKSHHSLCIRRTMCTCTVVLASAQARGNIARGGGGPTRGNLDNPFRQ